MLTVVLAVYAAVLSTYVAHYQIRRDAPHLAIRAVATLPYSEEELEIRITNAGPTPVRPELLGFEGRLGGHPGTYLPHPGFARCELPEVVAPGETAAIPVDRDAYERCARQLERLVVVDAAGRRHYGPLHVGLPIGEWRRRRVLAAVARLSRSWR